MIACMTRSLSSRFLSLAAVLLLALPLVAQTTPTPEAGAAAPPRELSKAEKEKKAVAVLREALKQSRQYSAPVNRMYIGSLAASLLWPHDEPEARALLAEVRGRLKELGAQPIINAGQLRSVQMIFAASRQLAVEIAAEDPVAALEFLQNTEPPKSLGMENDNSEICVAALAASKNPKVAERLAAEIIQTGDEIGLAETIRAIAARDPAGASQLANQLVDRVMASLSTQGGIEKALEFLLYCIGPSASRVGSNEEASANNSTLAFPQDSLRPLAAALMNAVSKPDFPGYVGQLEASLPILQKLAPAETAAFARSHPERAMRQDESGAGVVVANRAVPSSGDWEQPAALPVTEFLFSNNITLDEVHRLIGRAHVSQQEQQRALEQAERVIRAKLDHKRELGNTQLPSGNFLNAQVSFYVQWAGSLLARKDKKNAAALLEDARSLLPSEPESGHQMELLGQIAIAYCVLDTARAGEIVLPVVRKFNELLPSLLIVGDFILKDEMPLTEGGELLLSSPVVMGLGEGMSVLTRIAASDPEAALNLADQLQRPEVRTLAYLQIASTLLGKETHSFSRRLFTGVSVD